MDHQPRHSSIDDHRLAAKLAGEAADLLLDLKAQARAERWLPWELESAGDAKANQLLCDALAEARPDDAVLSEESADDGRRRQADRVWIIDPLDGSYDYGAHQGTDYAVHVGLVVDERPIAGAVAVPELGHVFATDDPSCSDPGRTTPVVVSGRSTARSALAVADALGGEAFIAGSAGVKAMAVVRGEADVYLHPSGLYEWDACAPAAVAEAAGLKVANFDGEPIRFNQAFPGVRGFLVARERFFQPVLDLFD